MRRQQQAAQDMRAPPQRPTVPLGPQASHRPSSLLCTRSIPRAQQRRGNSLLPVRQALLMVRAAVLHLSWPVYKRSISQQAQPRIQTLHSHNKRWCWQLTVLSASRRTHSTTITSPLLSRLPLIEAPPAPHDVSTSSEACYRRRTPRGRLCPLKARPRFHHTRESRHLRLSLYM